MFQWKPEMISFMKDASEYGSYYQRLADEMRPYLQPEDLLCDMGCGLGHLSKALSPYVKELIAADINKDALKVLEEALESGSYSNISAVHCDMNSLPERHYDGLIFCFNGTNKEIWDISQRLKPDKIFIMKKNYDVHRFSVGTYREPSSEDRDDLKFWTEKGFECIRKELEIEFGQPFRTVDDARQFFNIYSVDDDKSVITDEYLKGRLEETGRNDFPYYLPHMRKIRFIVLQNKGGKK